LSDITWFLDLVNVGGSIVSGGGAGLIRSVARSFITHGVVLDMKATQILNTLVDAGINYGRNAMFKDIREISTLVYSRKRSATADMDSIFAKSWMADIELPSHANYLVTFKVNVYDMSSKSWVESFRSMYTDERLTPNEWWAQMEESNEAVYSLSGNYQFLGIDSVAHNHGFTW